MQDELKAKLNGGLSQLGLVVDEACTCRLVDYVLLLSKWNKTHNLTAIKSPQEMVTRHLLDSLSISQYVTAGTLLDVGAGAGLPGIPLAITRADVSVTLVDSVLKKTQFMSIAASQLGLSNVVVKHSRVEDLPVACKFSMVTARAFADIEVLSGLTRHLLLPGGRVLAMIGRPPDHEQLESLRRLTGFSLLATNNLVVPGEQAQRNLVTLTRCEEC